MAIYGESVPPKNTTLTKMKTVLTISLLLAALLCRAQLEIVVKEVKSDKGNVRVGIFKDKGTFLKKAAYGRVVKAAKGEVTVIFDDLPQGRYAISVIHDENENGELDSNIIGIPKEGFGFGNNAMGTFGPPGFEKASITVEPGKNLISVSLRYL